MAKRLSWGPRRELHVLQADETWERAEAHQEYFGGYGDVSNLTTFRFPTPVVVPPRRTAPLEPTPRQTPRPRAVHAVIRSFEWQCEHTLASGKRCHRGWFAGSDLPFEHPVPVDIYGTLGGRTVGDTRFCCYEHAATYRGNVVLGIQPP